MTTQKSPNDYSQIAEWLLIIRRRFGHFHDEQLAIALASAARKEVGADAAPSSKL